jgi:hypothetical protein
VQRFAVEEIARRGAQIEHASHSMLSHCITVLLVT